LKGELEDLRRRIDNLLANAPRRRARAHHLLGELETDLGMPSTPQGNARNPSGEVGVQALRASLTALGEALLGHTQIDFRVLVEGERAGQGAWTVEREQRTFIETLVGEALANVERHAHAETVEIRITPDPRGASIRIVDDGLGICPAAARYPGSKLSGTGASCAGGLTRMQEAARRLRAHLEITSPSTGGTRVELSLPTVFKRPAALR